MLDEKGLTFIDFYADWCQPCMIMSPIIDELSEKYKDKIKIIKINVDNDEKTAKQYNVMSLPNFVLLKDGELLEQCVGTLSTEFIEQIFEKYI